ncbi:MAG: CdaR family protein [Herbinix sp.]|nr:CdaR family protein [Herbinix sp.]
MKEKLTRNIGVKILSVILATLLWLVITNVNDPVQYRTFSDVPVNILNESLVKTKSQSYEVLEGEMVEFKVAARRSIIESLSKSDFNVTADFANLSSVNSVNIMITPKRNKDDIEIVDRGDVQHLAISIEELSEKEIKINVLDKGKVGEGYYLGSRTARPGVIRVSGPKSRVDNIKQVIVEADVEGAIGVVDGNTRKLMRLLRPTALDEEGNVMDASRLSFSPSDIEVTFELYQIKEIPLRITAVGQTGNGYIMTDIDYQPKTIEVAAEDSKLRNINILEVAYDITGATENIEEFIELQDWLNSGVHIVGTDTTASVNITIEKLETKQLSIWPNDIEIKNKTDGIQVEYITKGPISVNLVAPVSEMESITRNTLKPYVNLLEYSAGTYYFDIETDISDNISIDSSSRVLMNLIYSQ